MPDNENPDPQNQPEAEPTPPENEPANPNAEAAKWRRRLRDTEAERDRLRAWKDDQQRGEIERKATERLASPADLWLASSPDAMRDDEGQIVQAKVDAELARVLEERPHWAKQPERSYPDLHQGPRASEPAPPPSIGQAFKKAGRRR